MRRLACVQLDSISTVERSHRIALASRVGHYPPGTVSRLLAAGQIFEFWAHEACLLPIEDYPWHTWRMRRLQSHPWRRKVLARHGRLAERVLAEIRERGPLGSRDFEGRGGGGMWNWKPAKQVLEAFFAGGELVIAGRDRFQRLYGLPEQVVAPEFLGASVPTEDEFVRWATLRAVRARGALTESAVAEMWRLQGGAARIRPHSDALVAEGKLERLAVDDGGPPILVPAEREPGDAVAAVLLTPFDNLLWDRGYLARLFGFRHVIEVYKRDHERVYGYYVLPFLWRDRLVGRADMKTDRAAGVLRVKAFHREPGVRPSAALDDALERAAQRLARSIEVGAVELGARA